MKVFTNGCFDVLHRGHAELLKYCRSIGGTVIVGLNSDASVRRLKGPARPTNCEDDRRFLLKSMSYVDDVIVFEEDTPYNLIKQIKPDVIVKGSDYSIEQVAGNDLCEVRIFDLLDGYSSTKTIQSIDNR